MLNYPIEHRVQASIIDFCKSLEGQQINSGSLISKKLSSLVAIGLLTTQQKKIYDCLTNVPKDTKTISQECKIDQIQVISQLRKINKTTQLISHVVDKRNKLWTKS